MNKDKITTFHYDDGRPMHITVLDEWTEQRRPSWKCCYNGPDDIEVWFDENCQGEYEVDFKFNSGNPAYFITIYGADDATLFKLRWL